MHVVYEYCGKQPFHPAPLFIEQPLQKKQFNIFSVSGENRETWNRNWFCPDSKLGIKFAIYKGACSAGGCASARVSGAERRCAPHDLLAMQILCELRNEDFIILESQLLEELVFDNQSSISYNSLLL